MKFTDELVKNYQCSQWLNFRRDLTDWKSRCELLGDALVYTYERGTYIPYPVISNNVVLPNPFAFSESGYCNDIIFPANGVDIKITTKSCEVIARKDDCTIGFEF